MPGLARQQVFPSLHPEVSTTVGHKEENCCGVCPGASHSLLQLLIKGCGRLTLFVFKSVCLLWFTAINLACINSDWQSPDGVYSRSCVPHFKQGIVASEFPPGKEGKGRQGVSQGQRVPVARRSLSLCLFTCTSCT